MRSKETGTKMTISAFRARPVQNQQMPLAQPPELVQEQQPSPRPSVDEQDPAPRPSVDEQEPGKRTWVHGYYGQQPPESRLDEHEPPGPVVDEQAPPPEVLMDGQEPPVDEEPRQKEWGSSQSGRRSTERMSTSHRCTSVSRQTLLTSGPGSTSPPLLSRVQ
jgi:hypothetical protein